MKYELQFTPIPHLNLNHFVLASFKLININTKDNPDLFRALKKGGSNWGILKRFDLYTYTYYEVQHPFKICSISDTEQV